MRVGQLLTMLIVLSIVSAFGADIGYISIGKNYIPDYQKHEYYGFESWGLNLDFTLPVKICDFLFYKAQIDWHKQNDWSKNHDFYSIIPYNTYETQLFVRNEIAVGDTHIRTGNFSVFTMLGFGFGVEHSFNYPFAAISEGGYCINLTNYIMFKTPGPEVGLKIVFGNDFSYDFSEYQGSNYQIGLVVGK